jgi:hypothetical protein
VSVIPRERAFMQPELRRLPAYGDVPGIGRVTEIADVDSLDRAGFLRLAERGPFVLKGVGKRTPAFSRWTDEFFAQFGEEQVRVGTALGVAGGAATFWSTTLPLRDFIRAVKEQPGLHLPEWTFFRRHAEYLKDTSTGLPDYLLEDWLELFPDRWVFRFSPSVRNNIWWGSDRSATPLHWDSLGAVTWSITLRGTKRWLLFDGHPFGPIDYEEARRRMLAAGLCDAKGYLSEATIAAYLQSRTPSLPKLEFQWVDVEPGDLIFVPERWAHQVDNLGESLSTSRYYVSAVNYAAGEAYIRETGGDAAGRIFRAFIGNERRRELLKKPIVRKILSSSASQRAFHGALRFAGIPHDHEWVAGPRDP